MLTNKTQTQVSISGLTYNNLIQDAYNALKDSDEFKNNFTSFTSNSAERMIVELYAYVATQLANRMDQMGNELFVDTASISGLSRLMKLVGAKLDFPSAASVNASFNTPVSGNAIVLSSGINPSSTSTELSFSSGSSFYKVIDSNGNTWEAINTSINDSGEIVYEYGKQITYTPSTTLVQALHEGITESQIYTINTTDTNIIRLTGSPVIKNSVRIYYKEKTDNTSDGIVELKKVDNFFTTDALTANNAVYTERNIGNGTCEIWIKPFISDSYTDLGKDLLIMYRVGGGEAGNISIGTIDVKNRIEIRQGTNNVISSYATMNITNITAGIGGRNELTTEEIRNSILQEVRNTKIAVTEEDYEYLLPKYDSAVMLVKCYGEKNDETANLAETYGYYTNPLNIWLLILKYNKTFSDAYMSDTPSLTDRINDIVFSVFDINPRFNEKYQINTASLNQLFVPDANKGFSEYFDVTDDNHVYRFPIIDGVKTLSNGNCLITVTKSPYIEGRVGDKRGADYFSRYDGEATPTTWEELSSQEDGIYLITDEDETGVINNRWKKEGDNLSLINFPYIYNNIISEGAQPDIMYIQQGSEVTSFSTVYSYLSEAFSASWDSIVAAFGNGLGGVTFNNVQVTFDGIVFQLNGTFATAEELCEFLNEKIEPETNVVILKSDISNINDTIQHSSDYVAAGSSTMLLGSLQTEVSVSLTGVETYSGLVNNINAALATALLNGTYKAMLLSDDNDCYNLALISKTAFSYRDKATEMATNNAFYTDVLGNDNPSFPIESSEMQLNVNDVSDAEGFIISADNIFTVDGDKIIVNSLGEETTFITENETLNSIFGTTSNNSTVDSSRALTVVYVQDASGNDSAYLSIDVGSKTDIIDWPFYINIFGTTSTQEIKLGSYYENIEDNLSGVSSVILSLLKRDPIKNLYSTNYIIENGESQKDVYGSNYQLKFSTGTIQEQTFNELSSQNSPAEVITATLGSSTLKNTWGVNDYLYMKVDNVESTKEISNLVTPENGYAKIKLNYFNGKTTTEFANTLVNIFTYTEDEETKYLLNCAPSEDYRVRVYTTSSAYYSSINFGDTPSDVVYSLFGISDPIVQSREGQIEATQISYKYLPITNNIAMGKSLKIEIWQSGGSGPSLSDDVSIGYSIDAFKANIENAGHIKGHVILDNSRIIFTDLANGLEFKVIVEASTDADLNAWKLMFGSAWSMFNPVTGSANKYECVFENAGDYYIEYREEDGGYYFHVENSSKFPYGDIYFHMYEDYTNDHIVSGGDDEDTAAVYTDEYIWNNLMTKKRVMLTEHIYKQPRFVTFDLDVVCLVHNTEQYSGVDYYNEVRKYLRTEYGLYSNNIGKEILPEDIIINIKSNFDKIFAVAVNYLGYDMLNSSTNRNSLETDFNQKHILASNKSVQRLIYHPEEKNYSLDTVTEHGLNLTIKFVNKREYN